MTKMDNELFEHQCKYCGFVTLVAKHHIKEHIGCPQCGKPSTVGEGEPEVEKAVQDSQKEPKQAGTNSPPDGTSSQLTFHQKWQQFVVKQTAES